jgi:hypothetical protein
MMISTRIVQASLMAVALVLGAGACSSAGPSSHAFEGSTTGTAQFGGNGNRDGLTNAKACNEDLDVEDYYKVTTYTSSDGAETELGPVHIETAHCNSPTGPQEGQIAFVTEDGDVLFGEYVGGGESSEPGGDPTVVTFMSTTTQDQCYLLNDVACQSTGRFENASGTATWVGFPNQTDASDPFIPWAFKSSWSGGTVTY